MTLWFGGLATYLFLPASLLLGLSRAMAAEVKDIPALAVISLGLGPLVASWLLTALLTVFPGRPDALYVGVILVAFAVAGLWGFGHRVSLPTFSFAAGSAKPYLVVVAGLCLLLATQAVVLPLNGNDPLEYGLVAKVIHQARSLANYPLRHADPATGLYVGSSHPLGYISLIVWTYMFSGDGFGGLSKSLSPFFTLATIALFLTAQDKDRLLRGALAALLLLGASLYYQTSAVCHIDSVRLYAMYLSLFCLDRIPTVSGRRTWGWVALCGVASGMSLFCHSIGLLTLPFVGVCWLAGSRRPLGVRLTVAAVICVLALAVGGWRYARNMLDYGTPIRDDEPVWSLPSIDYTAYNDCLKTISSPVDRLVNGVLTPFTRYNGPTDNALIFFGLSFWLALAAVALFPEKVHRDSMAVSCLICLGLFFALCLASALAGSSLIIKNVRYFLTVLPFAAYLGAIPAAALAAILARLGPWGRAVGQGGLILAFCGVTLLMIGANLVFALPNLRQLAQGDLAYLRQAYGGEYFYPAGYEAVAWVRENTPPSARILVFRKNEMAFYGGRRVLADTDPALLPFYAAADPDTAEAILREQGVEYIFTPNYLPPTFTNSQAAKVADDPRYCELVFNRKGYRVYRLRQTPTTDSTFTALPVPGTWSLPASFVPSFFTEVLAPLVPFQTETGACAQTFFGETVPITSAGVYSGPGPLDLPPSASFAPARIEGGVAYRFRATVQRRGWLKIFLLIYNKKGGLTWDVLFDGVPRGTSTVLSRLVLTPADAWQYRFLFVSGLRDTLTVVRPCLERLYSSPAVPAAGLERTTVQAGCDRTTREGGTVWKIIGAASEPTLNIRTEKARRVALEVAASRRADGTTLLGVLTKRLIFGKEEVVRRLNEQCVTLNVDVSGQGRVQCFVTWDDGAGVAYAGTVAPCGGSGVVALPVTVPRVARDLRLLFKLELGAGRLAIQSAHIEHP